MKGKKIILALDTAKRERAEYLLEHVHPYIAGIKIGTEAFCSFGQEGIRDLLKQYRKEPSLFLMLDLKLHDIPQTVGRTIYTVLDLNPRYITVHASGGKAMLERAMMATKGTNTKIVAVMLLTSLDGKDLKMLGLGDAKKYVLHVAKVAYSVGVRCFVCSLEDVPMLKEQFNEIQCIVPGVRLKHEKDDQKRVGIIIDSKVYDGNFFVVGRPITQAKSPKKEAQKWNSMLFEEEAKMNTNRENSLEEGSNDIEFTAA